MHLSLLCSGSFLEHLQEVEDPGIHPPEVDHPAVDQQAAVDPGELLDLDQEAEDSAEDQAWRRENRSHGSREDLLECSRDWRRS